MIPVLYTLFLERLCEIKSKKEIIPYELVFSKICRSFSITKDECRFILLLYRDLGFIDIHKTGIKILKREILKQREIKLLAHRIPKVCISHCEKCGKTFDAKITIEETCKNCSEELSKKLNEKVKKEIKKGNKNPKWVLMLQELVKENRL